MQHCQFDLLGESDTNDVSIPQNPFNVLKRDRYVLEHYQDRYTISVNPNPYHHHLEILAMNKQQVEGMPIPCTPILVVGRRHWDGVQKNLFSCFLMHLLRILHSLQTSLRVWNLDVVFISLQEASISFLCAAAKHNDVGKLCGITRFRFKQSSNRI